MEIISFDDFASMQEKLAEIRSKANEGLAVAQRSVTYGSYWVRFHPATTIFGYVTPLDEFVVGEMALGATRDEAEYEMEQIKAAHEDGMMWGKAYSRLEPDGEYGSTHRASLWPIEQRLFDAAMATRWGTDGALGEAMGFLLLEALLAFRTHTQQAVRQ